MNRRDFLIGVGAVLASAAIPTTTLAEMPIRKPNFTLRLHEDYPRFTISACCNYIQQLFKQVEDFSPRPEEHEAVIQALADKLYSVRPPGVKIQFEISMNEILKGDFLIVEEPLEHPMTVFVRPITNAFKAGSRGQGIAHV